MYDVFQKLPQMADRYYRWWRNKYPDETLYGIAFFSSPLVSYAGMTFFSEEGLRQVAQIYKDKYYPNKPFEKILCELRWSPCDSPHHMENNTIFDEFNENLTPLTNLTEELDVDDPGFSEHIQRMYTGFITALQQFRSITLEDEQNLLLGLFFGDQSDEERADFIQRCNPTPLLDAYLDNQRKAYS